MLAGLAVLIAVFYGEEDWRGARAWEQYQRTSEAKGERFEWASVIPPPVPDNENFALAPIVLSSYAAYVDTNGRALKPARTNIINRLQMWIPREKDQMYAPKNERMTNFGQWQIAKPTDLAGWQAYFRTPREPRRDYRSYSMPAKPAPQRPKPTNEFPVASQPQTPAADVLLALSRYEAALAELRQAGQRPRSRFPLNYEHPEQLLLAHLGSLRQCASVLQLRSIAELSLSRTEDALEDIKLALRLAEAIHAEPFFQSQSARIEIIGTTLQPVWEGLAARRWSDGQLASLQSALSGLDFFSDYAAVVRSQRALASYEMDILRRTQNESITPEPGCDDDDDSARRAGARLLGFYFHSFPGGWYDQNQLRTCRAYTEELLPLLDSKTRTVSPVMVTNTTLNGSPISSMTDRMDEPSMLEWGQPFWHPYSILENCLFRGVAAGQFAYAQGSVDLARVACALERCRLRQGAYPATLDALAPLFMDKLPRDIINGHALCYQLIDNSRFALYSVGWANLDYHGKVRKARSPREALMDVRNGNWVWRYP
jgi:hypothetical protein